MGLIGFILLLAVLNGVLAIAILAWTRSAILAVIASTLITELLSALYFLVQARDSSDASDLMLAANVVVIISTPVLVGTSYGVVAGWRYLKRRKAL
ncbi:MAG TPA: hypothetical protein VGO57_06755 [Verrucomicrobiae bacterium]|jgi:FtsH-binding integral membrane protein